MEVLASSGRFSRPVAGVEFAASDNIYISTAFRGNIIVSGVLFIVSAGTTKERTTAFLCWVNLVVWRRQAVTGCEEAGRVLEQWSGVGMDR